MPLRDHFHPPINSRHSWEGFHGLWPGLMTVALNQQLPAEFVAEPRVYLGSEIEVDVASFEFESSSTSYKDADSGLDFASAGPMLAVETELERSEYEVRIYDARKDRHLVAVIEIVSPSNKDRPQSRQAFVAKCQALLRKGVSVTMVDIVTAKHFCLYTELMDFVGVSDPKFTEPPATYAAALRWIPRGRKHVLETWAYKLDLGQPLPTLPLWLAENFAVPFELETTYEQTCKALRIVD